VLSEAIEAKGETMFRHACRMGLEGIVSKRLGSPYSVDEAYKAGLLARCCRVCSRLIGGAELIIVDPIVSAVAG
jgi:hypothetical protein